LSHIQKALPARWSHNINYSGILNYRVCPLLIIK
jgi:hypothetical protein